MASSPPLIRICRVLFGYLQSCTVLVLIGYALLFFISSYTPRPYRQSGVLDVNLAINSLPLRITKAGQPSHVIVERATGQLAIAEGMSPDDTFARITRSSIFVSNIVHGLFVFIIFHLLWRLCQNLEQREIFSERNLIFVRRLGLTLVAYAIIAMAADAWKGWRIGGYVADNLTFEGVNALTPGAHGGGFTELFGAVLFYGRFDETMFLTGLGVLLMAEVFRQGLALKQEADLTV